MAIIYNYFAVLFLSGILSLSGILVFKRVTEERRIQLLLPSGIIFGIVLFVFLVNLTAHLVKGPPGFYLAALLQIIFTVIVVKLIPSLPMLMPQGRQFLIWISLLFFWIIFLYQITAHAITDGGDSILYQSFASRFMRGDYPMLQPWQPDYIAYYHYGGSELLGSFSAITGAPFYFLHPLLAFLMLLSVSQILTWIIPLSVKGNIKEIFILLFPPLVGLVSLGGFFIAWPAKLELPSIWNQLPTLTSAFEVYGSPVELDSLVLFLHRFLAIAFFISLLVLLIYPKRKNPLTAAIFAIYLSTLALTDESVLIVTIVPVLIISFFTIFSRSIKSFVVCLIVITLMTLFQGGLITESILNRYGGSSDVLLFPGNKKSLTEKYLDYRLAQQKSKFIPADENNKSLSWFHPGIIWQLGLYFLLTLYFFRKSGNNNLKLFSGLLCLSAVISLIAYFGLVPKGYTHANGNRFLALSYYLSGVGLIFLYCYWVSRKFNFPRFLKLPLNIFLIWVLILSLLPPFLKLFPRKADNWFVIKSPSVNPAVEWIKKNLSKDKRILALTGATPSNDLNVELVKEAGALTPVWPRLPRVHDSFDVSPTLMDLHYTLNPEMVNSLNVDYILVTKTYFQQLPKKRQEDVLNRDFFTPVYTSADNSLMILEVNPKFLTEGENFEGTFEQFNKIAPLTGAYCIDYPPNISEHVYRILRFFMANRKNYCNNGGGFYNARIDIYLNPPADKVDRYDYLVLGKDVDPQTICQCKATLLWTGLGNGVKFWELKY